MHSSQRSCISSGSSAVTNIPRNEDVNSAGNYGVWGRIHVELYFPLNFSINLTSIKTFKNC